MNNKDSIILRSGLTMGGIVILALLSMTSSVFIAESSKGDAPRSTWRVRCACSPIVSRPVCKTR